MTESFPAPKRILAAMGGSDDAAALATAAALADRHKAALSVFAAVEPPRDLATLARMADRRPESLMDDLMDRARARIETLIAAQGGRDLPVHVATGKTFVEVIRHVLSSGADFVVKGAEPLSGISRFLFSSTDQHLLRKCPCPVWIQTGKAPPVPRRVLAAVDVDAWDAAEPETLHSLNRRVIDTARRIASGPDAEITLLHAWEAPGDGMVWAFSSRDDARASAEAYVNAVIDTHRKAMGKLIAEARDGPGPGLTPLLVRGTPEHVIEGQARALQADVVVMGTVARTGISGIFIGNTAENIINSLSCPVVAVKPDGFVSPLARP